MTPVVNGLEEKYNAQVVFLSLNAAFSEGKAALEAYRMPGHPSYVLLNPSGEVLWRSFGVVFEATLEAAIKDALETTRSN
jgi:hypothetical protein